MRAFFIFILISLIFSCENSDGPKKKTLSEKNSQTSVPDDLDHIVNNTTSEILPAPEDGQVIHVFPTTSDTLIIKNLHNINNNIEYCEDFKFQAGFLKKLEESQGQIKDLKKEIDSFDNQEDTRELEEKKQKLVFAQRNEARIKLTLENISKSLSRIGSLAEMSLISSWASNIEKLTHDNPGVTFTHAPVSLPILIKFSAKNLESLPAEKMIDGLESLLNKNASESLNKTISLTLYGVCPFLRPELFGNDFEEIEIEVNYIFANTGFFPISL